MAIDDCPSPPMVPKRKRTEHRHPSASSDSVPTEDEIVCIHALLALSRAPAIHDEGMTPTEEERSPLSQSEVEQQSQSLPSSSSSPPKQQQELPPISLSSLEQQEQRLSPPPMAERDLSPLPLPSSSPPKEQREVAPSSPPSLSPQDQPLPPPPSTERDLPSLPPQQNQPLPPPPPEQALSLVLCPVPIRRYQPPLPPQQTSVQRRSPLVAPAPTQQNQSRHACSDCGKVFSSYQALGGHKTSHRKRPAESSVAASAAAAREATNQDKPHTCPLCHKSFPTGQALGGHMRAHYEGNKQAATAESRAVAAAPSSSVTECRTSKGLGIDLNQPLTPEPDWAMAYGRGSGQLSAGGGSHVTASSRP